MTDRAKRDGTWDTVQDRSIPAERYAEFELLIAASPKAPEYNNVDATLWYFDAIRACHEATGDIALLRDLFPVLADIVDWHVRGTRYQIRVDPKDGLLYAGEPGGQLTWMDAKVDGWVATPRIGKQAEASALWYNALCVMVELARLLESDGQVDESYGRRSPISDT